MTNAEARFNKSLRPRKPEGSLGRTAQDVHLDSHTAPELWVAGQLRGDKECPFNGVTNSGRVWRKVPESDARSQTPSTGLRHPSFSGVTKSGRVWSKVPESDARSVSHAYLQYSSFELFRAIVAL